MSLNRPLFSIITVVRDDLPGLQRTAASLMAQSCRDVEWLVVDGDSGGETVAWLESRPHPAIAWSSAPDQGPYDAMNQGLRRATGDYVLFLNAGDCLATATTLAVVAAYLAAAPQTIDFIYGNALELTAAGTLRHKPARAHRYFWYGMFSHHQAMFYRRVVIADQSYDLRFRVAADYAFTITALRKIHTIVWLEIPICIFAPGGRSQREAAVGRHEEAIIRHEMLGMSCITRLGIKFLHASVITIRLLIPSVYYYVRKMPKLLNKSAICSFYSNHDKKISDNPPACPDKHLLPSHFVQYTS